MNPYDWQSYLFYLENIIRKQSDQLKYLERKIEDLETRIQENSSTNVEKIEYHFDQLKIETLEGTLNIGLSPQGVTSADELSIPNPTVNQRTEAEQSPVVQQIQGELQPFFQRELPEKLKEFTEQQNKSLPLGFENMIYEDIFRQLPTRIQHYIRLHSENHNGIVNDQAKDSIISDLKNEIIQSIQKFIKGKGGPTA